MRDLLTDRETAKLLRVKINSLYKTVDFFDEFDDDEWDLIEGEHFEYVQRHGELKERRFTEEGVEALAKYLEGDQEGLFSKVLESDFARRLIALLMPSPFVCRILIEVFLSTNKRCPMASTSPSPSINS